MTPRQVAVNHAAITAAADRLTATGWQGDAHRFVEALLLEAISAGYRPIEKPPPPAGPGSSDEQRRRILDAARTELAERRRNRATRPTEGDAQ